MLVSLVIPMYNSEDYIEKSIQSVLSQNFSDYEIIIIDDSSTDRSYEIAKQLSINNDKIFLYKNSSNRGICYTRNKGVSLAKGKYISFLDDDDELIENFFTENVSLLEYYHADFIKFGRKLIDVNSQNEVIRTSCTPFSNNQIRVYDSTDKLSYYDDFKSKKVLLNVWNGIYKKNFLETHHIDFDESMYYGSEDAEFSYQCFYHAKKIILNPKIYYVHYRRNLTSTSRKYNRNKIESLINTAETETRIWNNLINKDYINKYKIEYLKIIISSQLLHVNNKDTYKNKIKVIQKIISVNPLKIENFSSKNLNILDSILEFLVSKRQSIIIFILYRFFKIFGGEKWN